MKKTLFNTVREFKKYVYMPGEGHFFTFCDPHRNMMHRRQDVYEYCFDSPLPMCDYPKCKTQANYYFFPNLATVLKRTK